jgi:hypothetical protein
MKNQNIKTQLLKYISTDKILRKNLDFKTHAHIYFSLLEISNKKIEQKLRNQNINVPVNNPVEKGNFWIKNGLVVLSLFVPIPFITAIIVSVRDSQNIPCMKKCTANSNISVDCVSYCRYLSTKFAVDFLEKEIRKCKNHKKPKKCRKKLFKQLIVWKQKLEKERLNYEFSQRKKAYLNR